MISRAQVATYLADHLKTGRPQAVQAAAAWMVDTGTGRDARYLARDVALALSEEGYLFAEITSARPLSQGAREEIVHFIREVTKAKEIELATHVDGSLIGGAIVDLPGQQLDASIKTKLTKFVEGVSL